MGKQVKIGAWACKKLRGVARKRFRAAPPLPAPPQPPVGLAAGVASAVVASTGPAAAGLAAGVAVAGAAMATAGAGAGAEAAPGGPVWRLGRHPLVLGGWGLQLPGMMVSKQEKKAVLCSRNVCTLGSSDFEFFLEISICFMCFWFCLEIPRQVYGKAFFKI